VIVKSKHTSCYGCKLNKNNYCYWFNRPKIIPIDVINKGCKHREAEVNDMNTTEIVGYIIDVFNGEIIQ
jgi:hypothetical protein